MFIGCVKEIKTKENRVGLTPSSVKAFVDKSHTVYIEKGAGLNSGFSDSDYASAGAIILQSAKEIYQQSELIIKVKEPINEELNYLKENQIIFSYLHLAANKDLIDIFLRKKIASIAYETIVDINGSLPCLKPMSEIAGRLAVFEGAKYLQTTHNGSGVLLGGTNDSYKGTIVLLGAGNAGQSALKLAFSIGCDLIVVDKDEKKLNTIKKDFPSVKTYKLYNDEWKCSLSKADLIICSVLVPGDETPKLISKNDLRLMKKGTVIVDISIDQGGCLETSKPTTYDSPIYIVDGIIHYCVTNMPGSVPHTASVALNEATLPYGLFIANNNINEILVNQYIRDGINTYNGRIINKSLLRFVEKNK